MSNLHSRLVVNEVIDERIYQDRKWGGPERDDTHSTAEFLEYIEHYLSLAKENLFARRRLIQVAALAVAAVESIDRNLAAQECRP